ncbi:MAG TPA: GNAT family N-acetyltransferase [Puia sp.]|nr:GNAT family N-acetyltransferase [Puia sp.]
MIIREAISTDNTQLVQLTAQTPMGGAVGLRIDRRPDFFGLLTERGSFAVWVAEDDYGEIAGSFSFTKQSFIIHGERRSVFYLGDLKIHPRHKGSTLAFRLVKEMYRQLVKEDADLLFCTAAQDNDSVMDFFKGRAGIPSFQPLANFMLYQMIPHRLSSTGHYHSSIAGVTITRYSTTDDAPGLAGFYNRFYSEHSFYPSIRNINGCTHFVTKEGRTVTAAISVFDPFSWKQSVLLHYPAPTAVALAALRVLRLFLPLPPIPGKAAAVKVLYVKYFGWADGHSGAFLTLLRQVRHFAFENQYHLVTIAIDEKDKALRKLIRPRSRFVFRSEGWMTSLKGNRSLVDAISQGLVYEDFSLL